MMHSNLRLRKINWVAALLITSALCWWVGALALFPVIGFPENQALDGPPMFSGAGGHLRYIPPTLC